MDQNRKYLLVVNAENQVEYREVLTGPLVDGLRTIEKGLKADEWVIVNGLTRLGLALPCRPNGPRCRCRRRVMSDEWRVK